MKKLILLVFLVIGCGGGHSAQIVDTYTNAQGVRCFFLKDIASYTDYETGVYCKQ